MSDNIMNTKKVIVLGAIFAAVTTLSIAYVIFKKIKRNALKIQTNINTEGNVYI